MTGISGFPNFLGSKKKAKQASRQGTIFGQKHASENKFILSCSNKHMLYMAIYVLAVGFEPTIVRDLKSRPFDRSGTPTYFATRHR